MGFSRACRVDDLHLGCRGSGSPIWHCSEAVLTDLGFSVAAWREK